MFINTTKGKVMVLSMFEDEMETKDYIIESEGKTYLAIYEEYGHRFSVMDVTNMVIEGLRDYFGEYGSHVPNPTKEFLEHRFQVMGRVYTDFTESYKVLGMTNVDCGDVIVLEGDNGYYTFMEYMEDYQLVNMYKLED